MRFCSERFPGILWTGLLFIAFLTGGTARAQAPVSMSADTSLIARNNSIEGITVAIQNSSDSVLDVNLRVTLPKGITLISASSKESDRDEIRDIPVTLAASGKLFLPVKFRITPSAPAGSSAIRLSLSEKNGKTITETSTSVQILPRKHVQIQALSAYELISQAGDSIRVRVLIRNTGNTKEKVRLISSLPGAPGRRFSEIPLYLEAPADTTITIGYVADKALLDMGRFTINVAGMYENNDIFGTAAVYIENASSSKVYTDQGSVIPDLWSIQRNKVILIARNPFSDNQSWQLNANGSYRTARGKLDFNTYAYQSGLLAGKPLLSNTWINYEQDNRGILLGNVVENLEKFVTGRGGKVYYSDTARARRIEAGILDKSYNLLGDEYRPSGISGMTGFIKTQLGRGSSGRSRYTGLAVFDRDPYENSESLLFMNSLDVIRKAEKDNVRLSFDFGPAISRSLADRDRGGELKPSLATGLQFSANLKKYSFSSISYYSTAYYPGLRRGALQLNQRAARKINRANLWAGFNLYEYAPRSLNPLAAFNSYFLISRTETGVSFPLSSFAHLSFSPRYEYEEGLYAFYESERQNREMASYRLNGTLSWHSRNARHNTYLSTEAGLVSSPFTSEKTWHAKANVTYTYGWVNLNATLQHGNFSLVEAINNWYSDRDDPYRVSLNVLARKFFFKRRLQTEAGLSYFKDSFSGENWIGNGNLQYNLTPKTALLLNAQLYRYGNNYFYSSTSVNFQAGVIQALPQTGKNTRKTTGDIELSCFFDLNGNGKPDEGEEAADGIVLQIGKTVFITGPKGEVSYKKVPHGAYKVSMAVQKGWFAPEFGLTLRDRQLKVSVPLQKTGTLSGSVAFNIDARLTKTANTSLEGYSVIARKASGNSFRTRTDSRGKFLLFLPEGDYEISIEENKMPENVYAVKTVVQVKIEAGKINEAPAFELKVQEKKIEIKRFSAP